MHSWLLLHKFSSKAAMHAGLPAFSNLIMRTSRYPYPTNEWFTTPTFITPISAILSPITAVTRVDTLTIATSEGSILAGICRNINNQHCWCSHTACHQYLLQFISSLPPEHVLIPLHWKREEIHRPSHRNWLVRQPRYSVFSNVEHENGSTVCTVHTWHAA